MVVQASPGHAHAQAPKQPSSLRAAGGAALGRLLDALSDPERRGRTVVALLAVYCVVWTVYAVLSRASYDMHFDMGEMIAWSREVGLGTPKHPPLPAWLVGAWFAVMPLAEWSYALFAMVVASISLGIAFVTATRYLDGTKCAVGLAFLTLVPFYNFLALRFNANSAMTPWWALTTWFFLRSFETRSRAFAALAGFAAAGAMLTKYWSIVLLAALAIAALVDPRRRVYFASAAPYVTIAMGALALAPHVAWLYAHDFASFGYALESHPATLGEVLLSSASYLAGGLAYVSVPIVLTAIAARPSRAAIADMLWPRDQQRRQVLLVFVLPLLLPTLLALGSGETVVSLWAIGGMTLLPVVLLASPQIEVSRVAAVRILGVAVGFPFCAILLSPLAALGTHLRGTPNYGAHYHQVADAARMAWHEATDRPLRLVGSYNNLLYGTLPYFPERPSTLEIVSPFITPWTDEARIARDGILLYCPADESLCMRPLERRVAGVQDARRTEVTVARSYLGIAGRAERYVIVVIPPR